MYGTSSVKVKPNTTRSPYKTINVWCWEDSPSLVNDSVHLMHEYLVCVEGCGAYSIEWLWGDINNFIMLSYRDNKLLAIAFMES